MLPIPDRNHSSNIVDKSQIDELQTKPTHELDNIDTKIVRIAKKFRDVTSTNVVNKNLYSTKNISDFGKYLPQNNSIQKSTIHKNFNLLQEWEGYVIVIKDDYVTARLLDITADALVESVEVDIPRMKIEEGTNMAKVKIGSVFRWVIGYEQINGTAKRASKIIFRDLPVFTQSDKQAGLAWAEKIVAAFDK